jgi:hypothetical protein
MLWLDQFPGGRKLRIFLEILFSDYASFKTSLASILTILTASYYIIALKINESAYKDFYNSFHASIKQISPATSEYDIGNISHFIFSTYYSYGCFLTLIFFSVIPVASFLVTYSIRKKTFKKRTLIAKNVLLYSRILLCSLIVGYTYYVLIRMFPSYTTLIKISISIIALIMIPIFVKFFSHYLFENIIRVEYKGRRFLIASILTILCIGVTYYTNELNTTNHFKRRALILAGEKYSNQKNALTEFSNILFVVECLDLQTSCDKRTVNNCTQNIKSCNPGDINLFRIETFVTSFY